MKTILPPITAKRAKGDAASGAVPPGAGEPGGDGTAEEAEEGPWAWLPPRRVFWPALLAAAGAALAAASGLGPALAFLVGAAAALGLAIAIPEAEPAVAPRETESKADAGQAARAIVDALPTPLLVISEGGLVVHANPAAKRSLPRLALGVHHSSLIRAPEFVEAVAASLGDNAPRSVTFRAAPGRERILDARLSPLPTEALAPGGIVVQIEDLTELRRAEALRSDFIANASHELRTPLASIIGYIETLQNHARDDPAARERFLGIMEREAARMQRLVDDLMSLSRIEMTEHVRPQTPCGLAGIAAEAAAALAPVAEGEGTSLEIAVSGDGPRVAGDRDQLYQVFSNLIDNAIKYAGTGATVRVGEAAPSRAFPGRVGVTVEDTGPGIAREHLPRLTERFYRANPGQSRNKGGTGLGLAIVEHILNRHEGKLEIVSTPGKGSAFTVWLPRLPDPG